MNVVNEAAFLAARQGADVVGIPQLLEAVNRMRFAAALWAPGGAGCRRGACARALLCPTAPLGARRYGVNGSRPAPIASDLQKLLRSWLVDLSSSGGSVRTQPMGPS